MFALALTVALSSASGGLLSDTRVEARHARLIESPAAVVGGALLGNKPVDLMSLPELEARRIELEDGRRSMAGPVVLLVSGGVALLTSLILLNLGNEFYWGFYLAGALFGLAGAGLVIVGVITLIGALSANKKVSRELSQVEARISQLRGGAPPSNYDDAPPPPPGDEPPPPPPPSSQHLAPVAPTLVLASF